MNSNEIKVFVVSHKKLMLELPSGYSVISVGKLNDDPTVLYHDNEGDNISRKNKNYCELTALYWIWKNYKCDITGLVHYRRYLKYKGRIVSKEDIEHLLVNADILLPTKWCAWKNNYDQYAMCHEQNDMDLVRDIIFRQTPNYLNEYDRYMKSHETYLLNMFICKKQLMDKYCEWLFPILFELENKIDISNRDTYQQRIYGFISERLFNIWIMKNHIKIKELVLYETDEKIAKVYFRRCNVVIKKIITRLFSRR